MSVLAYPTCPTDCAGLLPDPSFSDCAPVWGYGEFEVMYIGKAGTAAFANVEDLAEWTTRLGLVITDDDAIRAFTIKGQLAAPTVAEVTASKNRKVRGLKEFNVAFQIDEVSDENYQAHLTFECGGEYVIWLGTADGFLFGGNEGIQNVSILTNIIVPLERTALRYIDGQAIWSNKKSPLTSINPNA
jgi:hypothetical protein